MTRLRNRRPCTAKITKLNSEEKEILCIKAAPHKPAMFKNLDLHFTMLFLILSRLTEKKEVMPQNHSLVEGNHLNRHLEF